MRRGEPGDEAIHVVFLMLWQLSTSADEKGSYVEVLETFTSLAPILDMSIVDLDKQGQDLVRGGREGGVEGRKGRREGGGRERGRERGRGEGGGERGREGRGCKCTLYMCTKQGHFLIHFALRL